MTNVSSRNDLRVFAARSRRGSSVGRTRGCSGSMRRYGDFNPGASCRGPGSPFNDLRVFAARSRRGSSVGRTRGCSGSMRRYGDFNPGASCRGPGSPFGRRGPGSRSRISRLKASYLSGRRCQPGQSSGYWLRWRQRNPLAFRGAQRQDQAAAEARGPDHGPMACGRVSLRMKMSRPW
jgi:hypothetical protein